MWRDRLLEHYPWAKVRSKLDELLFELSKAEDEENVQNSILKLHYSNRADLHLFSEKEREKIKKILSVLINDTKKHCLFLNACIKELKEERKYFEERCKGDED